MTLNVDEGAMTVDEFNATASELPCRQCRQVGLEAAHNPNNNGLLVVCPHCGGKRPLGASHYLKQNTSKKRRPPAPHALNEVWELFGNVCAMCGAPRSALEVLGIGRQAHHVMPYAQHGHRGPLIPLCSHCHDTATARQRVFWWWHRRLEGLHGESVSDRGTGVSPAGLRPDPVQSAGQAPDRAVEIVSDRHAEH